MTIKCFEDLEIWKDARVLCKKVHEIVTSTSLVKDYPLRDQIYRASGSVMDNIAEGFERNGKKEFIQQLYISKGSAGEVRSQIYRAYDYGHIPNEKAAELINDCKILSGKIMNFITYLYKSDMDGYKKKPRE